jgi:hypothetical protein
VVIFKAEKLGTPSIDVEPPLPYRKESPDSKTLNIRFTPPLAAGTHVDLVLSFPRVLEGNVATLNDTYNFTLVVKDSKGQRAAMKEKIVLIQPISAWVVADGTPMILVPWRSETSRELQINVIPEPQDSPTRQYEWSQEPNPQTSPKKP